MFILVQSKPRATSSLLRNHWGIPLSNHTLITYTPTKKVTLIPSIHTLLLANTPTLRLLILIPSRHTLLLANTPTLRLLILIPSRTHNKSQQTHKRNLFNRVQGLHLLQKIIWNQYKPKSYSTHFDQSQTLSNLSSLKNSKFVYWLKLKSVFLNIFKDVVCCQILTNS